MRSLFLLMVTLLLIGCGGKDGGSGTENSGKPGGKTRIAIVSNNAEEFWTIAEKGAEKAAKDFECEVVFRKPAKGQVSEQADILNALVKQNFNGIAVSVLNPKDQEADLKQMAKQTKLITMDNDAEGSNRICYVGTDNLKAGRSAGKLVARALPAGGTIAVFVGNDTSLNAKQRFEGLMAELNEVAAAKKVAYKLHKGSVITDNADRTLAQNNAKQVVEQIGTEPNVCLVGLYAYNPPAILEAVKSKGLVKNIKIVGFDEDNITLAAVASGEIEGTIVQDPFGFAYTSVEILVAEVKGDTSKRAKMAVPHKVITIDGKVPEGETGKGFSATEFKADLDAKLGRK